MQSREIAAIGVTPSLMGDFVKPIDLGQHVAVPGNLKRQPANLGVGILDP
ncbi:hypothetical protein [Pseudomonas sp. MPR-ANC1]|nr:hypothetical protein [Pseudomonas sp. MPR-ANC1]